jgi:vancomycin resistance protein YoaR
LNERATTQKREPARVRRRRRLRKRLRILIAVASVLALVAFAYLLDSAIYYNKVHAGVSVSGLKLGGLTKDEAAAALNRYVSAAETSPIVLKSGDDTWPLMPDEVGTDIDVAQAVTDAMDVTRGSNILMDAVRRVKLYFSDIDVPLSGTVDTVLMDHFLAEVAKDVDVPPVNPRLSIDGDAIEVIEGQAGDVVDQDALRQQLKDLLFSLHTTELAVPVVVKDPEVQVEDTQEAVAQTKSILSAPVRLVNDTKAWTLDEEDIAAYVDFKAEDKEGVATLVPYFSAKKMAPFFDRIRAEIATDPVDATWSSDGRHAWVVAAVPGTALDDDATAAALTVAALSSTDRTAEVAVKTTEAHRTTEEADAMGIQDKLGGYTTGPYEGTWERQINVRLTTKYANNVLLAPGEEYNFDEIIGPRTPERGYRLAKGITGPGKLEDVLGGGICQVSTTLFNAVFEAGLKITERHNHTLFISHYPPGRDATVTGGGYNFRFVNDTAHYILVRGSSDGVTTTFSLYGTADGRSVKSQFSGFTYGKKRPETTVTNTSLGVSTTLIESEGQSSRSCWVKRTITYGDGTKKTETFYSEWAEFPKIIQVGTGTGTTTTVKGGGGGKTTSTTKPKSTSTVVTNF